MVKLYHITNSTNNIEYEKEYNNCEEARYWILANLDLSLDWTYHEITSGVTKKESLLWSIFMFIGFGLLAFILGIWL